MTVRELIELLGTFPPDALVIHTFCSDYDEIEPDQISLKQGKDHGGLIRHHGHLMDLRKEWWPDMPMRYPDGKWGKAGDRPTEPNYVTAVHFAGN